MSENFFNKKLKQVIKKEIKKNINHNSRIYDYEKWDSLGNFNILLTCEKVFKIKFNSEEFNRLNSFKEILKIVKKKKKIKK